MTLNRDVLTGAFFVALGGFLYIQTYSIEDFVTTSAGAAFLPTIAAVLFITLGAVLAIEGWRTGIVSTPQRAAALPEGAAARPRLGGLSAVLLTLALMTAYVGLLEDVGFVLTTIVYIFCQTLILARGRKSNYLLFAAIAVVMSTATYWIFVRVFQVMIPSGLLG